MAQGSTVILRGEFEAGDSALVDSPRSLRTYPLVLWHLLSLDAPTVAVVWTMFAASMAHTVLPAVTLAAMGLAVWTLYAADRLLDSRSAGCGDLEVRHLFHDHHRRVFLTGIAASTGGLAFLLPMLPAAALHLYLTEGAFVAGYFLLIHAAPPGYRRVPKELLVGPFFAAAVFIPTVSRDPETRFALLPLAALFGVLCSLNCLYIYAWEHPDARGASWATGLAVRGLRWLTWGFLVAVLVFGLMSGFGLFALACGGSGLGLVVLHRFRGRFSGLTLRALADAVLLSPVMVMVVFGWG